jgi:hypothetical protein
VSPVKRFLSPVLIGSLLIASTGCGNVFIRGAINPESTTTGSVSVVQLGSVLNGSGGTIQVTFVTFLQNGFSSTIAFCDDETSLFLLDQTVRVNFTPGRPARQLLFEVERRQFLSRCARYLLNGGDRFLSGAADVWIDVNVPQIEQPFRDVAAVPVLLAPAAELKREDIPIRRQSQLSNLEFELRSKGRTEWDEFAPVGIAAAIHSGF